MERNPAEDESEVAEIIRGFLAVQARTAADENRPLQRGTHAKGVCARAVFTVLDNTVATDARLARRCAVGVYASPGSYPATVRFANSAANMNDDWEPDVRSLSFAIELGPSARMAESAHATRHDFSLQSAPTLPFNDVHAFAVYARVAGTANEAAAVASLPFDDQLVFARTKQAVLRQQRQTVRPYQQLRYWSNVPFRHGADDVVKYSASPGASNPACALKRDNPHALRDELLRHLNEDAVMSAFDIAVQFLDVANMTYQGKRQDAAFWIENASIEWPEDQAPFHTVARLSLVPQSALSPEACAGMYIDVTGHSLAANAPLGRVNRARWHVEVASREARQDCPSRVR